MAEQNNQTEAAPTPSLHVAPAPHFGTSGRSTRWMMYDIILALLPAVGMSLYVFGPSAALVIGISIGSCLLTEAVFQALRGRKVTLIDGSAVVTGLILALSLPWSLPWWIPLIGGVVAVAIGKMIFGGLGQNIFNPAMVGRAFLMICFAAPMANFLAGGQAPARADTAVVTADGVDAHTNATPMSAGKFGVPRPGGKKVQARYGLASLAVGNVGGSLGETSALLLLAGGVYLCIRRTVAWQIPAGVLAGAMIVASIQYQLGADVLLTPLHHLTGGALMFGAFFIATDPVSSPVSVRGRWAFGLGVGALTMIIRLFASYPEGMMFAVLILNSVTPLINRWTIPAPVGGRVPKAKPAAG